MWTRFKGCSVDLCHFPHETTEIKSEQGVAIRFCIRLKKTVVGTVTLLREAYQDGSLGCSTILRWHRAFVEGRQLAVLIPHSGQPATATPLINANTISKVIEEPGHEKNSRNIEYDAVVSKLNFT